MKKWLRVEPSRSRSLEGEREGGRSGGLNRKKMAEGAMGRVRPQTLLLWVYVPYLGEG